MHAFLSGFVNLPVEEQVSNVAVVLRKKHKIKLPEAIVWAAVQVYKRILVTRKIFLMMSQAYVCHIKFNKT